MVYRLFKPVGYLCVQFALQGTPRIHEIYENSAAARNGQLRPGDRILRINEADVSGLSHEAVVDLLRSAQDKVSSLEERHCYCCYCTQCTYMEDS